MTQDKPQSNLTLTEISSLADEAVRAQQGECSFEVEGSLSHHRAGVYEIWGDGKCLYVGSSLHSAYGVAFYSPGKLWDKEQREDFVDVVYRFHIVEPGLNEDEIVVQVRKMYDELVAKYLPKHNRQAQSRASYRPRKGSYARPSRRGREPQSEEKYVEPPDAIDELLAQTPEPEEYAGRDPENDEVVD